MKAAQLPHPIRRFGIAALAWVMSALVSHGAAAAPVMEMEVPAPAGAMAPHLSGRGEGVLLSWIEPSDRGEAYRSVRFARIARAPDAAAGWRWSTPRTIVTSDRLFANWADVPSVHEATGGFLLAHWLARSGDAPYAYDVAVARSTDDGRTWNMMGPVHDDGTQTEHGFVSVVPEGDALRMFWLDGRETAVEKPMTLRTAVVGKDRVIDAALVDASVCDCCQTTAALPSDGPVVLYRDRSEGEIRDIAIARHEAAAGWTPPAAVHADGWEVPGCPVNGPSADAAGRRVAAAWFTAAGNAPRVLAAFSEDAGRSFGPPVVVDEASPQGRAALAMAPDGGALVAWLAKGSGEDGEFRLRHVAPDGAMGAPVSLAASSSSRASGFPGLAVLDDAHAVMVWTHAEGKTTRLEGAIVRIDAVPRAGGRETVRADAEDRFRGRLGDSAPDFEARRLAGDRVSLRDFLGEAVLLNVWATWCAPCREEMPILEALHARHGERGLRVIGVSVDDAASEEAVRRFVRETGIRFTVLLDPDDRASRVFGLPALPGTFLFDRSGRLVAVRRGVIEPGDDALDAAVETALSEASAGAR